MTVASSPSSPPPRKGYLELPLKRLSKLGALQPEEQDAIRALDTPRLTTAKGQPILAPDTRGFHFILEGWACRQREIAPGRRLLFDLILPGDVVGRLPDDDAAARYSCVALTPVVTVEATALSAVDDQAQPRYPGIVKALILLRARVQERLLDHVVRLGACTAYDSLAHLLLELHERLTDVGLTSGGRMPFPIAQERVGELLGLSEVHVGRTLTKLKTDGYLEIGSGWLALPRIAELAQRVAYTSQAAVYSM